MSTVPTYQLISAPEQLEQLYAALDRVDEIALDMEADSLYHYRTRVCLLQIYTNSQIFLVDTVANLPLDGLWPRLAAKHLIMHGSDYDLRLIRKLFNLLPKSLFDTMFAAQLLNIPHFGLAALLDQLFNIKLDKNHQKANWSKRPLTKDLLDYAALDVFHLYDLRDCLMAELTNLGRLGWLEQKCLWQINAARNGLSSTKNENAWRISGSGGLKQQGLTVLHAIWHWREIWAEKLNKPPFKVIGNHILMKVATAAEDSLPLEEILRVNLGRRHGQLFSSLGKAVHAGLAGDPRLFSHRQRHREYTPLTPSELSLHGHLKAKRDSLAKSLNINPTLVATRSQLVQIARNHDSINDVLLPWQAHLLKVLPPGKLKRSRNTHPFPPPPRALQNSSNIARHLPLQAAASPQLPAIKIPRGRTNEGRIDYLTLSYAELDAETNAWASRLQKRGVQRGDRVLVMVRQGLPLMAATFALFKIGAVPVIIDPGIGHENFLECVARSRPRVLLGTPFFQIASHLYHRTFKTVKIRVLASGNTTARLKETKSLIPAANSHPSELAAILFTSGSTSSPKGVCYEHGTIDAQVRLIREAYQIKPGEIDLPMLPIFALFNPALGMTTIVPEIDPSNPAKVDPAKIIQAIQQEKVTNSFGSPTLWHKIAGHCQHQSLTLPSIRRVLAAGAPVSPALFFDMKAILPNGEAHSPYGATESLPIASITATEVLNETAAATLLGAGTCVGLPLPETEIRVIVPVDAPIEHLAQTVSLATGEIGELIVRGPVVTKTYDQLPCETTSAKIASPNGVWHRLGDVGYLDVQGRLWFCGRKAERIETLQGPLYTEQVEPIFSVHPDVLRTALIGLGKVGDQQPALVIEPLSDYKISTPSLRLKLIRELRALGQKHAHTRNVRLMFLHPHFPVDVRHNAKVHRLALARWAAIQEGYESNCREAPTSELQR